MNNYDAQIENLESRVRILEMMLFLGTELIGFADEQAQKEYATLLQTLLPDDSRRVPTNLSPDMFPALTSFLKARGAFSNSFRP